MGDETFRETLAYRTVFGIVHRVRERYHGDDRPEAIRAEALAALAEARMGGGEFADAIAEALEDALAWRQPKW